MILVSPTRWLSRCYVVDGRNEKEDRKIIIEIHKI